MNLGDNAGSLPGGPGGTRNENAFRIRGGSNQRGQARTLCGWIRREIGPYTPLHFVRFYPSHRMMDVPPTPSEVMEAHCEVAKKAGLHYAYIANSPGHKRENTYCPKCGKTVIARFGYEITNWDLDKQNRCKTCGYRIPIAGGVVIPISSLTSAARRILPDTAHLRD